MAEIRWTKEAVDWLQLIHDYISKDSIKAANKVVAGIFDKVQVLRAFPNIGHKYRDEQEGVIRILLYGHYKIGYLIKGDVVEILGVFHSALKMENYLKDSDLKED